MIQIYNKIIPFKSYRAMAIWPFMFLRSDKAITPTDINHENIHGAQQLECLLIAFYIIYGVSWLIELIWCTIDKDRGVRAWSKKNGITDRVYRSIIFEREAYKYESDNDYLSTRKYFSWLYV